MKRAPKYPVDTLAQMASIPVEARGRFLAELPEMHNTMASVLAFGAALPDDLRLASVTGTEWIDDDKGQATITTTLRGPDGKVAATSKSKFKMKGV